MSRASLCVLLAAMAAVGSLVVAGDLNPPAGPVAPTMKTLDEVEARTPINAVNTPGDADSLFKITAPGSYYLTGNITGVLGKHGVEIAANGVTIDLNGFEVAGVPGSLDGVSATTIFLTNITIRNGTIRGWGGDGVDLDSSSVRSSTIADLVVTSNNGAGVIVDLGGTITSCVVAGNGANGITTGNGAVVSGCLARANNIGIQTGAASNIFNCQAIQNGSTGISVLNGSSVANSSAYQNSGNGISLEDNCTATECAASGNVLDGISGGDAVTITGCTASANSQHGIEFSWGVVDGCTASFNGVEGIRGAVATSHISDCSVSFNGADGIVLAGSGGSIIDCNSSGNTSDGIQVSSDCIVRGNTCDSNGSGVGDGAGIVATGSDNRIEANNCTDNDRGIDVNAAGNLIIRNSCAGNTTNWDIAAGNVCLVVAGAAAPAILGNSGGVSPGSTDPNANFSY